MPATMCRWFLLLLLTAVLPAADGPLDALMWDASASNNQGRAMQAIDGDAQSRWDTGGSHQVGQWFQIDMGEAQQVSRVEIDTTGSSGDYLRSYELTTSNDGKQWTPVANGKGATITTITLAKPQVCRFLRVAIPAGSQLSGGYWSIHDFRVFGQTVPGAKALPRPPIRWRTVTPTLPTRDVVLAAYDIRDFGVDPAKGGDVTKVLQLATRLLSRAGGGTLWLPAGRYRLSEPLVLTRNTAIRGDWAVPVPGRPVQGTIIELTANRGQADGPPGITLHDATVVKGLTLWHPEQKADAIVPYPVAVKQVGGVGMAVEDITFVNAYRGFACGPEGCALFFVRNVHGTILETGVEIDGTADIGRMERVRFAPTYWSGSGLPGAPAANGPHVRWIKDHATAVVMRRNDWSYVYDLQAEGCLVGFHTRVSFCPEDVKKNRKSYPNGQNARLRFRDCRTGIRLEEVSGAGIMFHDCEVTGAEDALLTDATFTRAAQFQACRLTGSRAAIRQTGTGQLLLTGCALTGTIDNPQGFIGAAGCTPAPAPTKGSAPGVGEIRVAPLPFAMPADPYALVTDRFAPPTARLAVVTDPAYGAKGDGITDDTAAVKKALAAMAQGGGTVFLPAGAYRITAPLTVPTGVELRGVSEGPHHAQTRGSVLDVIAGKGEEDGTPFITVAARAGLRGLTFHYPEQDSTDVKPYPWMVRGAGEDLWIINITCTFAYRMLDLATHRCDRHYVDYASGSALREAFRVGGGSVGGRLINCQLNPNYYSFTTTYNNSPSRLGKEGGRHGDAAYTYAKANGDAFVIGDCTKQILFQNFVFGVKRGLVLTGTSGPSGWCLGHGSDQCCQDIWAERIGAAGMPFINSQFVTVDDNGPGRCYIGTAPAFTGTLQMLGVDGWGTPLTAARIEGGRLQLASAVFSNSGAAMVTLRGAASAQVANVVQRSVRLVVDRDRAGDNVQIGNLLLLGQTMTSIGAVGELDDELTLLRDPSITIGVDFPSEKALPTTGWKIKTSANQREADRAIDGNPATRWCTPKAKRGDEVVVELEKVHTVAKVRFDTSGSKNDFVRRFQVFLSTDGSTWGRPVATGMGETDLRIAFPPRPARFIRLVSASDWSGFWSIHEIQAAER